MRTPRLVATDLDGTLLRTDLTVSDRTRAALGTVEDSGATVVLVTGRPPRWMPPVVEQTGATGLAVCANGALVYDLERGEVVRRHPLEAATATRLTAALREALPEVTFAVEYGVRFGHEPEFLTRAAQDPLVGSIEELLKEPIVKLLIRHPDMTATELHQVAAAIAGEEAVATYSGETLVEVSGAGVSKAFALAHLADDLEVTPDEAVAFGDMPNDLPMLEWSGHAVAVANAHPSVREVADEVTASNDEDGVALVLERLFG
jgi:Cof subfamily protein (haloacid dehalogenase superfamily)